MLGVSCFYLVTINTSVWLEMWSYTSLSKAIWKPHDPLSENISCPFNPKTQETFHHLLPMFTQLIHCVSVNNLQPLPYSFFPTFFCWWKVQVERVRSVQRGKNREECFAALSSNVGFLSCCVRPANNLVFHFNQVFPQFACSCLTHGVWQTVLVLLL